MITSKNNDIGNLIQQCRPRDLPPKERKALLTRIEEILNGTECLEELPVKWTFLLDNVCWPILTRTERGDTRNIAGRLIRIVGERLFDSDVYPEFLIWIGTLYQSTPPKSDEVRADLVHSVSLIVTSVAQKTENRPIGSGLGEQHVLSSLKWIVDVVPKASVSVYNQCLKGILSLANTHPKVAESYFEPTIRTIFSNLKSFNTHDKIFEQLLDTVTRFAGSFAARPAFAEEIVRAVRPDIQNKGLGNMRELKRHMSLTMAVVKMAKSDTMLHETSKIFSEIAQKCEENGGVWSSAALVTIVCDVLNELLILGKEDACMRTKVEESMSEVLRDLDLSKQNTKEKHAFFNSLAKIVKQLPVESVIKTRVHQIVFDEKSGIFSPKNRDCRIFGFNTIYKDLANLIAVLLTPTSLNHLQATYTDLRKCMLESMTTLRTYSTELHSRQDVSRWHEMRLLLFFSALQGISLAKSSLIVMMGIRPSIFEFFADELPLTEYWLASNHPKVYHTFVVILFAHLKSHEFYIPQSDYLERIRTDMEYGRMKREYAKKQIVALNKIISTFGDLLNKKTRLVISSWLQSLIMACLEQKMAPSRFGDSPEWVRLKHTVQHHSVLLWNNESIHQSLTILAATAKWPEMPSYSTEIEKNVLEKTKKAKWKEATAIWEAGDCMNYIRQSVSRKYQMSQERQQKYISQTSFGADEFTLVTNFLLRQIVPNTFRKGAYVWMDEVLETLTHACRPIQSHEKHEPVPETFIEKWDWAINQTANYCIVNKMKTPLGKPMQTFNAIAVEIGRLAKEVMTKKAVEKKKKEEEPSTSGAAQGAALKYSVQWLRVHLLLKFIEVLEKLMSSAIRGGSSSFVLAEIPLSSRQFFTTNSHSCELWLNRLYYPALIVAYFNGYYGLVIRFGSSALSHYARQKASDEKMTSYGVSTAALMCLSMAVLGEPMEIVGIRRRVRDEFATEQGQPLMEALGEMAHARYENALVSLETILVTDVSVNETLRIIIQMAMIDMLNRIRLPQTVDYYKSTMFGGSSCEEPEDFRSIEMLTKFEKLAPSSPARKCVDWSARERVGIVESAFSQPMRRGDLVEQQKELAALGALALSVDTSSKLYADISSTSLIIANLVDRMNGVASARNRLTDVEIFDRCDQGNEGDKLAICRKLMHWSRHMKHFRGHSSTAHGEIIRLSRKTGNRELARFHINSAVRGGEQLSPWMRLEVDRQRMKLARQEQLEVRIREMNEVFGTLSDVFQTSCQLKTNFELLPLDGHLQHKMLDEGYTEEIAKREEHMSRASIQLAEFFDSIPDLDNVHLAPDLFPTMLWSEIQRRSDDLSCGYHGIVGSLLTLASEMCPSLAKSHLKMAKWAYEMAGIEHSPSANVFPVYQFGETAAESDELWKCLETTSHAQLEKLVEKAVADQHRARAILAPNGHFLRIWEMTRTHRTKFLSIAVSAYFQFIQNQMTTSDDSRPYSKKEETTLATLRILELLVKHGDVLAEHIADGLAQTNVHVWKEILPQLFARLSHPSEHIRKTLVDLISRICTAAPHAVVFQVVSGAASSSSEAVLEEEESLLHEQEQHTTDDRNRFRVCCEQLETNLAQSYPSLVRDVRRFAQELERINLLNEEKWSVVLGTLEHEMEKRLSLIRAENQRTAQAAHLSPTEKEEIICKKTALLTSQLFDVLDELYQQTVVESPKTRNEEEFVKSYSEILSAAFAESKLSRVQSPEKSWAPFKSLIATFVHLKKGMQTFETEDISPYLAALEASCVPMPGQESVDFDRVVTIAKVSRQVTILPTKTRPKKLGIVGSDGRQVTFLFKGREDLHLDERVMQFLRLCNVMLAPGKRSTLRRRVADYQAHHYAVIPLGPRSGLIKWVEGATPMFHIYRKWQMKEKALKQAVKKNGETVAEIERPSDMYHKLIRHVFTSRNIDINTTTDRSKWPTAALEEVFELLSQKTPDDLLSRELWMRANDAGTWWAVTRRYARSLAVMSMVGSVLGLGDRHLDNLLVDLKWGHVVHIDYNICFDKGKNLRIPETVPFRLTQNMRRALGPSEVYGTFRESCVHVLSTLRAGRQVLTMLLDAFVFDPLVDWTSHEHTSTSSGGISLALQLAVYGANWKSKARERLTETRELLQLRMDENRHLWLKNREDLAMSMQKVTEFLQLERSLLGANGIYAQERVKAGLELRDAVARHQVLAKELRPLIRAVGRERGEFTEWLKFYKHEFIDPLLKGHSALKGAEIDVDTCVHNFNTVIRNSEIVFITLLKMLTSPIDVLHQARNQQQNKFSPLGIDNVWALKQDQQENSQAREVVRRVERRLNGWVDEATDRKMTPREEADHLIDEATNASNLALMYEGWTAWV